MISASSLDRILRFASTTSKLTMIAIALSPKSDGHFAIQVQGFTNLNYPDEQPD